LNSSFETDRKRKRHIFRHFRFRFRFHHKSNTSGASASASASTSLVERFIALLLVAMRGIGAEGKKIFFDFRKLLASNTTDIFLNSQAFALLK
jgi:hypothetical protein